MALYVLITMAQLKKELKRIEQIGVTSQIDEHSE